MAKLVTKAALSQVRFLECPVFKTNPILSQVANAEGRFNQDTNGAIKGEKFIGGLLPKPQEVNEVGHLCKFTVQYIHSVREFAASLRRLHPHSYTMIDLRVYKNYNQGFRY